MSALITVFALLLSSASAESLGDDLSGRPVIIERSAHKTALVFWSAGCDDCTAQLLDLEAEGAHVVAISTDASAADIELGAPVISDADGRLQRLFQIQEGVVVLSEDGTVEATIEGSPIEARALLFPAPCDHSFLTAQVSSR